MNAENMYTIYFLTELLICSFLHFLVTHYFFLSWIGELESFGCSFGASVVTSQIYTNGQVVKTVSSSYIWYTIDLVKDVTHNQEYSCIGKTFFNQKSYVNLTIIALSK